MSVEQEYRSRLVGAEEAVAAIQSGDRIFMAPGCSAPQALLKALCRRRDELEDVAIISANLPGHFPLLEPEFRGHIDFYSFFLGSHERAARDHGNVLPISLSLSDLAQGLRHQWQPTVLLAQVAPPDEEGRLNFGPMGVMVNEVVADLAERVILQANDRVPRVHGESNHLPVTRVDLLHEASEPLWELSEVAGTETDERIARHVVEEVEDGSTIQIGIGATGNAVAYGLAGRRHLGIHSEMFTEAMVHLVERGVADGSRKSARPGKIVCGFALGSRRVYDFVDENPEVHMIPIERCNRITEIAANDRMVSINSALAVDLTGQVASEGFAFRQHSGIGGQLDFVRGAYLSEGGKSFLAMHSTFTRGGVTRSKIVPALAAGTPVTTPRSDVHWVVTEHGKVNLKHRSLPARVQLMISIAHPDFREELEREARERGLLR